MMNVTKQGRGGRGRGSGRGGGTARGGRGRGRGKGRTPFISDFYDVTEDDELCQMALTRTELDNSSIAKAFEEINNMTELPGFDETSGDMWVYPTNRPVRDYQFDIVKTALFHNTLVSLPTGLGKTFISAVVMYNFQRWYPTGITVFMAPTRPLVKQQLDACHNTVGIRPEKTVELTGSIPAHNRENLWKTKNVFFLTPQVMASDMDRKFFDPNNVRCIVVDEAHKALGNQAYVKVIARIVETNKLFRVLALSATPGSDIASVQQVLKNLLISRVELRSEDSPDVLPYVHTKNVEKVVVKMEGLLKSTFNYATDIYQFYVGKLLKAGAISGNGCGLSKFQLLKSRDTFRQGKGQRMPNYEKGYIEVDFAICISLSHAVEILQSHGLRAFYLFLNGVINKEKGSSAVSSELSKNDKVQAIIDLIRRELKISATNSSFNYDASRNESLFTTYDDLNKSVPPLVLSASFSKDQDGEVDYALSHPKMKVLRDIVKSHFEAHRTDVDPTATRIMIFSQLRDSVQEIGNMLNQLRPLVKPMIFVGKANTSTTSRGLKQKDQMEVVRQFREGGFNVLVSTSVGEEGLDIGEVDLIICFDSSKSPTRLIQRMGRTGRQRDGRTVFLLTEGKEERSYGASVSLHSSISKNITDATKLQSYLYKQSPRMLPVGVDPTCYKMRVILTTEQNSYSNPICSDDEQQATDSNGSKKPKAKKKGTKAKDPGPQSHSIADMFRNMKNTDSAEAIAGKSRTNAPLAQHDPPRRHDLEPIEMQTGWDSSRVQIEHSLGRDNMQNSIFSSIFDMNAPARTEYAPCVCFDKKFQLDWIEKSYTPKAFHVSPHKLNEEMVSIDLRLQRKTSYVYALYCKCGNKMESPPRDQWLGDEALPTFTFDELLKASKEVPSAAPIENPDAPVFHILEPFDVNSIPCDNADIIIVNKGEVRNTNNVSEAAVDSEDTSVLFKTLDLLPSTPPAAVAKKPEIKTPGGESEDSVDEFPPSPDICENRIYREMREKQAQKKSQLEELSLSNFRSASSSCMQNLTNKFPAPASTAASKRSWTTVDSQKFHPKQQEPRKPVDPTPQPQPSPTTSMVFKSTPKPPAPTSTSKLFILPSKQPPPTTTTKLFKSPPKQPPSSTSSKLFKSPPKQPSLATKTKLLASPPKPPASTTKTKTSPPKAPRNKFTFKKTKSFQLEKPKPPETAVRPSTSFVDDDDDDDFIPRKIFTLPQVSSSASDSMIWNERSRSKSKSKSPGPPPSIQAKAKPTPSYSKGKHPAKFESPKISGNTSLLMSTTAAVSPALDIFKSPSARFRTSSPFTSATGDVPSIDLTSSPESPVFRSEPSVPRPGPRRLMKLKRFKPRNPFLATQAEVESDDGGSEEPSFEDGDGLDDSFVDNEESFSVSFSQQAHYMRSIKDLPAKFGRVEKPLSPKGYGTMMETSGEGYEQDDSFCQDEVEFADVGVFTQAMNQAKVDLAAESNSGGYQTRRTKRQLTNETENKKTAGISKDSQSKRRRRVFTLDNSSSDSD